MWFTLSSCRNGHSLLISQEKLNEECFPSVKQQDVEKERERARDWGGNKQCMLYNKNLQREREKERRNLAKTRLCDQCNSGWPVLWCVKMEAKILKRLLSGFTLVYSYVMPKNVTSCNCL